MTEAQVQTKPSEEICRHYVSCKINPVLINPMLIETIVGCSKGTICGFYEGNFAE
jgi:hypothetical protein